MDKATAVEPNDAGQALQLYRDALEDFRRFRDVVHPDKEVLNNMGVAYAHLGALALARGAGSPLNTWFTSLAIERDTALKYKSIAPGASRGGGDEVPYELTQAIGLFKEALAKDPDYRRAAINLAVAQIAAGKAKDAIDVLNRLPAANGAAAADTANAMGVAQAVVGTVAEAEKAFKAALAAQPGQAQAMFNLGRLYQSAGKKADAQAAYKAYLAKYPSGQWAEAAKKESAPASK
jgi:tetratricopeptide (TPR) repeat protein